MKSRFILNNNEFYDSFIDDCIEYKTDIDLILIELPIISSRTGHPISVESKAYSNINEWFQHIGDMLRRGSNTLYLYEITKTPAMYNPITFGAEYKYIIRQCFRTE